MIGMRFSLVTNKKEVDGIRPRTTGSQRTDERSSSCGERSERKILLSLAIGHLYSEER